MHWAIKVAYLTAAGQFREEIFDVEHDSYAEAEEAAVREVMRQPGREIVGVEVADPEE